MAFSRFRRSTRRTFSRRPSFRRTHLKRPFGPDGVRWDRANFYVGTDFEVPNTSDNQTTVSVRLAAVDNVFDTTTPQGRALEQSARRIELGGIVLMRHITPQDAVVSAQFDTPADSLLMCREHLIIDRTSSSGGSATAGTAPYNRSQVPTASVVGTGPAVEADEFPTKIIWSNMFQANLSVISVVDLPEDTGVVLDNGRIRPNAMTLNKRLRYILDDQHAFNYTCSFITEPDYAPGEDKLYRLTLAGWIFWRLRF